MHFQFEHRPDCAAREDASATCTPICECPCHDARAKIVLACARATHETNRAYCIALGDTSQLPWEEAPQWQKDSEIHDVANALRGATPRESHESWMAEKLDAGWKFGLVKNPETREHPCLVAYDDLPPEQRAKDHIFITVARAVGGALGIAPPDACRECGRETPHVHGGPAAEGLSPAAP